MSVIRFQVPGIPAPQGSKRAFVNKHTGRASLVEMSGRHKDWRAMVSLAASEAATGIMDGPVHLRACFRFPRPKSHYRTGRNADKLRDNAPTHPGKPDLSKLVRSIEDAMTGIVYRDDSQIVSYDGTCKTWADGVTPGVTIEVRQLNAAKEG